MTGNSSTSKKSEAWCNRKAGRWANGNAQHPADEGFSMIGRFPISYNGNGNFIYPIPIYYKNLIMWGFRPAYIRLYQTARNIDSSKFKCNVLGARIPLIPSQLNPRKKSDSYVFPVYLSLC